MGYKPKKEEPRSLEEMAGVELAELSSGRQVIIKTHSLGTLWKFQSRLSKAVCDPSAGNVVRFFQYSLESLEAGVVVRLRRLAGLADFPGRVIRKELKAGDARKLRDAIVKANLGMDFEDYYARCLEAIKKKIQESGTSDATGERSRRCCSATEDCDRESCLK